MGSMAAIEPYKNHHQRAILHEVTGLNGVGCKQSQNSMVEISTAAGPIPDLIAGGCWARSQLRNGIKDVSIASELMTSLTLLQLVFIGTLVISELEGRSLHTHSSDPEPDCWRLLGSTPATQWYKARLCGIATQEIADPCESWLYRYCGDPRARWHIPPEPVCQSWI